MDYSPTVISTTVIVEMIYEVVALTTPLLGAQNKFTYNTIANSLRKSYSVSNSFKCKEEFPG